MTSSGPSTLSGEFIRLRPLAVADAALTLRWRLSDRALMLNRGAETARDQRAWVESRPSSEENYVIELLDGTSVGMLSLVDIDLVHKRAEPSRFLIGEEERARGIPVAIESMKLLYQHAFHGLGLQRLYGTVLESNRLMIKWQKYLGMTEEGRLRRHYFIDGRFQDAIYFAIFVDDFQRVALPRMNALLALGRATLWR